MIPFSIDGRTMAVFTVFIVFVIAVSMAYMLRSRKTFPGFGTWTAASAVYLPSQLLVALQGIGPDWLSVVMANALIFLSFQLVFRGLKLFSGEAPRLWLDAAVVLLPTACQAFLVYDWPNMPFRVAVFSLTTAAQAGLCLAAARRCARRLDSKVNVGLAAGFAAVIAIAAARTLTVFLPASGRSMYILGSSAQAVFLMLYSSAYLFIFLGLQTQNAMRVEDELLRAADEVKTLSGIIPICAHCKKVRNDSGYWEQVEAYVKSRTDADFSHSICPDCLRTYYPEQAERMGKRD